MASFLNKCNVESRIETIQPGSTLVIDANGFFFQVVKDNQSDILIHLGDYGFINSLVINEINKYLSRGITLVFYLDGQKQMKYKTAEKRAKDRDKERIFLYNLCISHATRVRKYDKLPTPVLALEQFRDTLKSLNMNIEECDGEADQAIARACHEGNKQSLSDGFYCLGDDG